MTDRFDRRHVLLGMGAGAAGLVLSTRLGRARTRREPTETLAERLRIASYDESFGVARQAIAAGVDRTTFLGAVFLAGLREIRPRPHGILHVVMMVESIFRLGDAQSEREAWLPALFNLHDLKRAQTRDIDEFDDWSMPARPTVKRASADPARREFLAAMEAWDAERADRAVLALLPHCDREQMFELLWLLGARCVSFIGHKMIYVSQVERALARIGWKHAEPALRSMVRTLLVQKDVELFARSREVARQLPDGWLEGKPDPAASDRLVEVLKNSTPAEAQDVVVQALRDGLATTSVFDALRLLASEVFHRRPGRRAVAGRGALLPVHALTVLNAFLHAWRSTRHDATRRILTVQAVGAVCSMPGVLGRIVGLSMDGPGLGSLEGGAPPGDLDDVFESGDPRAVSAFLEARPEAVPAYLGRLRRTFSRTALEHHQHKYAVAMIEEAASIDPRWRTRILAPAIEYLAHPQDEETEVYRRSSRVLDRSGRW